MNLKHLTDSQLNLDLKNLVQKEREVLTSVLYRLKEMETRKLYSSLGYTSLFDYACKELKYSSDQAYRRIQAMRLLKDIPEVSKKIDSGELSLSNISQAQKYFKDTKTTLKCDKVKVLKTLLNKSVRDGQKELLKFNESVFIAASLPSSQVHFVGTPLPKETKKQITSTHTQVSFNMSEELENKLTEIKSLLGPKAYNLSMSELIERMADLAKDRLMENKFGKKRIKRDVNKNNKTNNHVKKEISLSNNKVKLDISTSTLDVQSKVASKEKGCANEVHLTKKQGYSYEVHPTPNLKSSRYISKKLKYTIWQKANMKCESCGSKTNLQMDHVYPFALGGETTESNLRLLCFNCNQRHVISMKQKIYPQKETD